MNELAVKAANGTNSETDRTYIQNEIDQLTTEIDRVSETTKFNETYLLKGDKSGDKANNFQYKEVEVTNQDLYYVENGKVNTLKKGSYTSVVDTAKHDYYTSKDGVQVYEKITGANKADYKEAFRFIHTLKGTSVNLGFDDLYQASCNLTECLRKKENLNDEELEEAGKLLQIVKNSYQKIIELIVQL